MTSPRASTSPRGPTSPRTPITSPHIGTGARQDDGDTPTNSGARYTSLKDLAQPDGSPSPLTPTRSRPTNGSGRDWNFARGVEEELEERERRQRRWSEAHPREIPDVAVKAGKRMSLWRLIALTISMGGSQVRCGRVAT